MAVSPMKLVTIVGPLSEFDKVVRGCIINQEFHPESAIGVMKKVKGLKPFDYNNPYSDLLRHAELISDRTGIGLDFSNFPEEGYDHEHISQWFSDFEQRYGALVDEREELLRRVSDNEQIMLQLDHVKDVNLNLQDFFHLTYVKFRFGKMPRETYDTFYSHIEDRNDVYFFQTSVEKDFVYGMYMTPRKNVEQIDALFASLQFDRVRISDRVVGSSDEAAKRLTENSVESRKRIDIISAELENIRSEETSRFLSYYSYVRFQNDSFNIRHYAAHTMESFYILGWVPADAYLAFAAGLDRYKDIDFIVVSENPSEVSDYSPPVRLKNSGPFKIFEPYVAMYGIPAYNEIDPTPLMTLAYTLFFGIMFGDVGQGAFLILCGWLMWQFKKMWMGRVVMLSGVSSIIFGFIYGSVFGNEEWLAGFKVMEGNNSQSILEMSIYGGAGIITIAILLNIINGLRQKKLEKTLLGASGVIGLVLYWALVLLVFPLLGFGKAVVSPSILLPFVLIPVVIIFLREPLLHMIEKHKEHEKTGGIGDFIASNFFEMFEILMSYLTNTMSFLRVGAYAISHASMMTVVYTMAEGAGGTHNIVVLIIGNLIVAGMEGVLVSIQVLRLNFYEIFGRFYDGSGRVYEPMKIDYKTKRE